MSRFTMARANDDASTTAESVVEEAEENEKLPVAVENELLSSVASDLALTKRRVRPLRGCVGLALPSPPGGGGNSASRSSSWESDAVRVVASTKKRTSSVQGGVVNEPSYEMNSLSAPIASKPLMMPATILVEEEASCELSSSASG
eukprot:TRINITY_DN3707_c0_g1_i1.p2 TRINITY_DN3707_c0_g1~~TRINITY_DN3707_c0_g1_i1.p2  ORF type:complete len:146 (-),score=22.20 TRINITY_DN3707_c0_g1_i1:795-1232(-)